MSNLLPILYNNTPQMQLCALCPRPGDCCSGFNLKLGDRLLVCWMQSWQDDAKAEMERLGLPFVPAEFRGRWRDDESGEEYVEVLFACHHLSARGRCEIYEDRPHVCRDFQPASSALCGFHRET